MGMEMEMGREKADVEILLMLCGGRGGGVHLGGLCGLIGGCG